MKAQLRHLLFNVLLVIAGSVVAESDIITGHHEMEHFRNGRIHYVERPKDTEKDE